MKKNIWSIFKMIMCFQIISSFVIDEINLNVMPDWYSVVAYVGVLLLPIIVLGESVATLNDSKGK